MKIQFQLVNGEIYTFENYSNYSELIENLEPDLNIPIEILEPFTIEEFKIANLNYISYISFKNAILDIKSKRKLWNLEELTDLSSKYDLDNPVLNWLMVKETYEEKKLKENIKKSYYPLKINEFNKLDLEVDNFFDYYFIDCEKPDYIKRDFGIYNYNYYNGLRLSCCYANLEIVKWFLSLEFVNRKDLGEIFIDSCIYNRVNRAKWFYENLPFDNIDYKCIHHGSLLSKEEDLEQFINYILSICCSWHSFDTLKWLYSIDEFYNILKKNVNKLLINTLNKSIGEISDWFITLPEFNKNNFIETSFNKIFTELIYSNNLDTLEWLLKLLDDTHKPFPNSIEFFKYACFTYRFNIAKFIYNLSIIGDFSVIDIHDNNDEIFYVVCRYEFTEIIDWLYQLDMTYYDNYIENNINFKNCSIKPCYFRKFKKES